MALETSTIRDHLAIAERHVAEGERHIARQRNVVKQLGEDGHDQKMAFDLLALFEDMQQLHISDRDRLRTELARLQQSDSEK